MPSTYSSLLRVEYQAAGDNAQTWGDHLNDAYKHLEHAIAGRAAITHDNTANYTLTANNGTDDEARRMFLALGGTLTAARNAVVPTVSKLYIANNATTGGFDVTVKTSGGTGITVPNGKTSALQCDGTNVIAAFDWLPSLTLSGGASLSALYGDVLTAANAVARLQNKDTSGDNLLEQFYTEAGSGTLRGSIYHERSTNSFILNGQTALGLAVAGTKRVTVNSSGIMAVAAGIDNSPLGVTTPKAVRGVPFYSHSGSVTGAGTDGDVALFDTASVNTLTGGTEGMLLLTVVGRGDSDVTHSLACLVIFKNTAAPSVTNLATTSTLSVANNVGTELDLRCNSADLFGKTIYWKYVVLNYRP